MALLCILQASIVARTTRRSPDLVFARKSGQSAVLVVVWPRMALNRRQFVHRFASAAALLVAKGQTPSSGMWGGPVVDCHHHLRRTAESNVTHLEGCGVSNALVLARENTAG